jgi:Protein of unknown function (DUF2934)
MPDPDRTAEGVIREAAYFIWERDGRPAGRALDHWGRAIIETCGDKRRRDDEPLEDEEKVLAGHPGANMPALLTKDVPGG